MRITSRIVLSCLLVVAALAGFPADAHANTTQSSRLAVGAWYSSCYLDAGGGLWCWGSNDSGDIGDGTKIRANAPVQVPGLSSGVKSIALGEGHGCAVNSAGGVVCWGFNQYGEVGDGTTTHRASPVQVSGLTSGVASVSAFGWHTCALKTTGAVVCWGRNDYGQLGDGSSTNRTTPVQVSGLTSGVANVSVAETHTCVLLSGTGAVKCWGNNAAGQLGDGTKTKRLVPTTATQPGSSVTALSAGGDQTCAVKAGGLRCWGSNVYGQLGNGTTTSSATAVQVSGLTTGVSSVAVGVSHACALLTSGGAKCWGRNLSEQLGNGGTTDSKTPVQVVGLTSGVTAIAAGGLGTMFWMSGGYPKFVGVPIASGIRTWAKVPTNVPRPGSFVPMTPTRVLDTRDGTGGFTGPVSAEGVVTLPLKGVGGLPGGSIGAVVLNVTVVAPTKPGNIRVYPSDAAKPNASSLNFVPGQTVPNLVTVKAGADGSVKLANSSAGTTHLIADVMGYYVAGAASDPGAFVPLVPTRLLDTRSAIGVATTTPGAPPGKVSLLVAGVGGIPAGASAIVLNVTETAPSAPGNITVFPGGTSMPVASNLNFVAGDTRPNQVTVKVGADGRVNLSNSSAGTTHLIADVAGYYLGGTPKAGTTFVGLSPARILDTRSDALGWHGVAGPLDPNGGVMVDTLGYGGIPEEGVSAVMMNVTETAPTAPGSFAVSPFVLYSSVSNLNFLPGQTYPNQAVVAVVDPFFILDNQSDGATHAIVDVAGYFIR